MNKLHNPKLKSRSQTLRKNMTQEERHLWYDFFKALPITVHRQKSIGPYIVDFYIAAANLVIELDGSQHYEAEGIQADAERDQYMKSLGLTVLRYSNRDINQNFEGVCQDLWHYLNTSSAPSGQLLLQEKPNEPQRKKGTKTK